MLLQDMIGRTNLLSIASRFRGRQSAMGTPALELVVVLFAQPARSSLDVIRKLRSKRSRSRRKRGRAARARAACGIAQGVPSRFVAALRSSDNHFGRRQL
jgi:hypothetical protein